ncbi:MAG: cation:proton antiporter, partial [Verrucomicrobiota bacterium]
MREREKSRLPGMPLVFPAILGKVLSLDAFLIAIAFLFGLLAQQVRLPPLVGFLVAGFVLQAFGKEGGATLDAVSELGVTLLLFSIGLKLKLSTLARPEIWAGTTLHSLGVVALFAPVVWGVSMGVAYVGGADWRTAFVLAFALSFSSTVFSVKALSENGDLGALHGRSAMGILVMQDIMAVLFLTFSTGKLPSIWVLAAIPALLLLRPVLYRLLTWAGHGELLSLCGLFLALVAGAKAFDVVGLKA